MLQFMMEVLLISLIGCGIGVGLSWTILKIVSAVLDQLFRLSGQVLATAVGFSVVIGVLFGIYPANQAAKKHPIEALRHMN